jgi:hypothetical protein
MESEIYQSMQRFGVTKHRNNVSFSLDNIEFEPHLSFEQTVHSFEDILTKIKKIQRNYLQKMSMEEKGREGNPSEEINLFLAQLINYRMAVSE